MQRRARKLTRRRVRRSPFLIAAVLLTPLLLVGSLSQRITISQSNKTVASNEAEVTKPGPAKSHSPRKKESPSAERSRTKAVRPQPNLAKEPTLYVVGYAHLDTQWRWEYPQVINEYIRKTMEDNFTLFEKYPHYVFNFSGANRYRFMKEYFPADFEKVKKYVDSGRWFPAGSSMEEGDVNAPSAETIIRQIF